MSFDAEFLSMLKDHISLKPYSPLLLNDLSPPKYNIAPIVVVDALLGTGVLQQTCIFVSSVVSHEVRVLFSDKTRLT